MAHIYIYLYISIDIYIYISIYIDTTLKPTLSCTSLYVLPYSGLYREPCPYLKVQTSSESVSKRLRQCVCAPHNGHTPPYRGDYLS